MGKAWMVLGLLVFAAPVMAEDFQGQSTADICVRRAMALITALPNNAEPMLSAEIQRRGETCADPSYVEIAKQRLAALGWRDGAFAWQREAPPPDRRDERIRSAGRAYLEMQQQRPVVQPAKPVQTTCRQTNLGTQCTTW